MLSSIPENVHAWVPKALVPDLVTGCVNDGMGGKRVSRMTSYRLYPVDGPPILMRPGLNALTACIVNEGDPL